MQPKFLWIIAFTAFALSQAQSQVRVHNELSSSVNFIVPQSRIIALHPNQAVRIDEIVANVKVVQQAAVTQLEIKLTNPTPRRLEAELMVPVPQESSIRGFTFQGAGSEPTIEILCKEEAERIYNSIVAKMKDPALLEFIGCNLIRSSVFPVEAGSTQRIQLTYEHLLKVDGNRVDYILPRSESLNYSVPWRFKMTVSSKQPISTVYSPSHEIQVKRPAKRKAAISSSAGAKTAPGSIRISWLLEEQSDVTASLMAYPDPSIQGGYFLLLAGLPREIPKQVEPLKREVTLVLDRSGSMRGDKLAQVKEAVLQILAALEPGERFNIMLYSEYVDAFAPESVEKSKASLEKAFHYIENIQARGGTNIYDALSEALRQPSPPEANFLPVILFLTDGLPTVGQTAESKIRDLAMKHNPQEKRIFTFGVGLDVNTPLLDKIANETRGVATYVLPEEDIEVKVSGVFERLSGPILALPRLKVVDNDGQTESGRVSDLLPHRLPDLFKGDQLALLGRYIDEDPLHFQLEGNYLGRRRVFQFDFQLDQATTRNAFIPRLWASRRIGVLADAVRQLGAEQISEQDPRMKELVDEIVKLSTEFGVLTEYTAFLAREGTVLTDHAGNRAVAMGNFNQRAIQTRSGMGSMNQSWNYDAMANQVQLNYSNGYYNEQLKRVEETRVQQVNDLAFYQRGNQWIDSRVVNLAAVDRTPRTVQFNSSEYFELFNRLAYRNRQGVAILNGEILIEVDGEVVLIKNNE